MTRAFTPPAWLDRELILGVTLGALLGGAVLLFALPLFAPRDPARASAPVGVAMAPANVAAAVPAVPAVVRRLELGNEPASPEVQQVAGWVVAAADNGERPFVIVDKRQAKVFVFEPTGRLRGASPVLLGYASGDHTVEGIGDRPIEQVKPEERTTPAGRFVGERGRNALNEDVLWVDYDAAVSMHRVRLTNPKERRAERLASPSPADNRISYGCINLPPAFFDTVLWPSVQQTKPVVYVLPEVWPLAQVFPGAVAQGGAVTPSALSRSPG